MFLEAENAKLTTMYSQLSSEKDILKEKLRQVEEKLGEARSFNEQQLRRRTDELKDVNSNLEYYKNKYELSESKLNGITFEYEEELRLEREKISKLEAEMADVTEDMRKTESQLNRELTLERSGRSVERLMLQHKDQEIERLKQSAIQYEKLMAQSKEKLDKFDEIQLENTTLRTKVTFLSHLFQQELKFFSITG